MDYEILTDQERAQIVRGHLQQAEADYLIHTLNALKADATGNKEAAAQCRDLADQASAMKEAVLTFAKSDPIGQAAVEPSLPKPVDKVALGSEARADTAEVAEAAPEG
jgi:Rps23 Pro-64 3,4-dihydroxylase Tpa1-like proline 4-hydroxylase